MIKNLSRNALNIFVSFFFAGFLISGPLKAGDPKTVFKQNCAVCHYLTDKHSTGPGLKGIADRAPKEGDWLFRWIKNNEKVTKSGDAYASKIVKENGGASMTVFEGTISDDDIHALIEYIKNPPAEVKPEVVVDAGGGEAAEAEGGISPLYIILSVIVILALLISILRGVRVSLRNITNKKEGKEAHPVRFTLIGNTRVQGHG